MKDNKNNDVVLERVQMTLDVEIKAYEKDGKVYEYLDLSTFCYGVNIPLICKEDGTSVSKALLINKTRELLSKGGK